MIDVVLMKSLQREVLTLLPFGLLRVSCLFVIISELSVFLTSRIMESSCTETGPAHRSIDIVSKCREYFDLYHTSYACWPAVHGGPNSSAQTVGSRTEGRLREGVGRWRPSASLGLGWVRHRSKRPSAWIGHGLQRWSSGEEHQSNPAMPPGR